MDWKMLREECPLALDKYILEGVERNKSLYFKYLYDFFDDHGIFVSIGTSAGDNPDMNNWYSEITIKEAGAKQYHIQKGNLHNTREESEHDAFTEAFIILEKQLKK